MINDYIQYVQPAFKPIGNPIGRVMSREGLQRDIPTKPIII